MDNDKPLATEEQLATLSRAVSSGQVRLDELPTHVQAGLAAQGAWEGLVASAPKGAGGFSYNSSPEDVTVSNSSPFTYSNNSITPIETFEERIRREHAEEAAALDRAAERGEPLAVSDFTPGATDTEGRADDLAKQDEQFMLGMVEQETGLPAGQEEREIVEGTGVPMLSAVSRYAKANEEAPVEGDVAELVGDQLDAAAEARRERNKYKQRSLGDQWASGISLRAYLNDEIDKLDVLFEQVDGEDEFRGLELLGEVVTMILPFTAQVSGGLGSEDLLEDRDLMNLFFAGQNAEAVREKLLALPPHEQYEAVRKLGQAVRSSSGIWGLKDDQLQAWMMLQEVNDFDDYEDSINLSKIVEDAITFIDVFSVSKALKGVMTGAKGLLQAKLVKGKVTRTEEVANAAGAEAAGIRALSTLEDGAQDARAVMDAAAANGELSKLRMTEVEYVEASVGIWSPAERNKGIVVPGPTRNLNTNRHIERLVETEDITQMQADAVQATNRAVGGGLQINKSSVLGDTSKYGKYDPEEESFELAVVMGKDQHHGWPTVAKAKEDLAIRLGVESVDESMYVVKVLDPKTGKLIEEPKAGALVEASATSKPEIFVEVKMPIYLRPKDVRGFSDQDWVGGFGVGWFKTTSSWLSTGVSKMTEPLRKMNVLAVDMEGVRLEDFTRRLAPYSTLNKAGHKRVDSVLRQGETEGKVYTPDELARTLVDGNYLTQKEIEGYYAFRDYADNIAYPQANKALRQKMLQNNVKWVHNDTTDFSYAASPVPTANSKRLGTIDVYDPDTRQVTTLSQTQIDEIYSRGGAVAEGWRGRVEVGSKQAKYVLVDGNTKIHRLPQNVLKNNEGYIPRRYNTNFFVMRQAKGAPERAVATSFTRKEAEAYAEAMFAKLKARAARQGKPEPTVNPYRVERSRENLDRAVVESDIAEIEGLMFYQNRNQKVIKTLGKHKGYIEDPYNALASNTQMMSQHLSTGRIVDVMEQKWMNTPMEVNGVKTTWGEYFVNQQLRGAEGRVQGKAMVRPTGVSPEARRARAAYDYIARIKNQTTQAQEWWRDGLFWLAEKGVEKLPLVGKGMSRSTYALAKSQQLTPWALLKNTAFTFQILLAPLRQGVIQSHQALMLTGIDPTLMPKSFLGHAFYLNGYHLDNIRASKGQHWKRAVSIAFKEHGEEANFSELKNLARGYEDYGLPMLRSQIALEDTAYFNNPIMHTMGELGYAFGERHNLAATFSFSYKKYLKDTGKEWKKLTKEDWDQIAFKAREYSLNMTRSDAYKYQRGALSAATQYLAIRMKAMQTFAGSDAFTGQQKLRMIASQGLLFGAEGLGLGYLTEKGLDMAGITWEDTEIGGVQFSGEELKQAVLGGLIDRSYNEVMRATLGGMNEEELYGVTGEPSLEFSKNMSALGGMDLSLMAISAVLSTGDANFFKMLGGPGVSQIGNLGKTYDRFMTVWHGIDDPANLSDEDIVALASAVSSFSSSTSALSKAVLGLGYNVVTDSRGTPIATAQTDELWTKGVFGFTMRAESEYYVKKYVEDNRDGFVEDMSDVVADLTMMAHVANTDIDMFAYGDLLTRGIKEVAGDDATLLSDILMKGGQKVRSRLVLGSNEQLSIRARAMQAQDDAEWADIMNSQVVLENKRLREAVKELRELRTSEGTE